VAGFAGTALAAALLAGCGSNGLHGASAAAATDSQAGSAAQSAVKPDKQIALYTAMRTLWAQHMEWTYATVDAFFHDHKALTPTLNRLLANQHDIGAAIEPYYGKTAADQLTKLLTTHINDAVPVLQAAQAGNQTKLNKALATWNANAKQIADFLTKANPENWPASATEPMLRTHISQTTAYAVDLLKGNYAKSIKDYDKAERHMLMLADTLSKGVIAQFPQQFN
jgi:hypothetical protein